MRAKNATEMAFHLRLAWHRSLSHISGSRWTWWAAAVPLSASCAGTICCHIGTMTRMFGYYSRRDPFFCRSSKLRVFSVTNRNRRYFDRREIIFCVCSLSRCTWKRLDRRKSLFERNCTTMNLYGHCLAPIYGWKSTCFAHFYWLEMPLYRGRWKE